MSGWIAPKANKSDRKSFSLQFGFSKQQRQLGEDLIAARSAYDVLEIVERRLPQLNDINAATALNRIAKCVDGAPALEDARFRHLEMHIVSTVDARVLSNSAWALSTLA